MFIGLLGVAFTVVATYFVVKTARENGRSGIFWGSTAVFVGLLTQYVLPIFLSIILILVYMIAGRRVDDFRVSLSGVFVDLACIALSVVALMFILKQVSKLPDEPKTGPLPPPPPTFDQTG